MALAHPHPRLGRKGVDNCLLNRPNVNDELERHIDRMTLESTVATNVDNLVFFIFSVQSRFGSSPHREEISTRTQ